MVRDMIAWGPLSNVLELDRVMASDVELGFRRLVFMTCTIAITMVLLLQLRIRPLCQGCKSCSVQACSRICKDVVPSIPYHGGLVYLLGDGSEAGNSLPRPGGSVETDVPVTWCMYVVRPVLTAPWD